MPRPPQTLWWQGTDRYPQIAGRWPPVSSYILLWEWTLVERWATAFTKNSIQPKFLMPCVLTSTTGYSKVLFSMENAQIMLEMAAKCSNWAKNSGLCFLFWIILFEADYAKNYAGILYQCLPAIWRPPRPEVCTVMHSGSLELRDRGVGKLWSAAKPPFFTCFFLKKNKLFFMQIRTIPFERSLGFENRWKNDTTGIAHS